jgi:Fe-S cluster biogenesis protein NfuA
MADLRTRVAEELAQMAPYLARSGASVDLIGIEDGIAQVHLRLTRPGPNRLVFSLQMTSGIERALKQAIPELRGVEALNLPPHTLVGWDQPAPRPAGTPGA